MTGKPFKDLFSAHSGDYARFRPHYPAELFNYLASLVRERRAAWDCGTGNGQAAVQIANHFESVWATDPSQEQMNSAVLNPRVQYVLGSASASGLANQSVTLITAAQAFHWFNHTEFFQEAARVACAGQSALAVWSYALAFVSPEVDAVVTQFYSERVGAYWEPERRWVEQGYQGLPFPLEEIPSPQFEMSASWNLHHLIGYLGTWSAVRTAIRKEGRDPVQEIHESLAAAWGATPETPKSVRWPLALRVGKL